MPVIDRVSKSLSAAQGTETKTSDGLGPAARHRMIDQGQPSEGLSVN